MDATSEDAKKLLERFQKISEAIKKAGNPDALKKAVADTAKQVAEAKKTIEELK